MENKNVKISGGGVLLSDWKCLEQDIEGICNPNLLINTDFTHPVNQRGQNNYETQWSYGIDMWCNAENTKHYVRDGYLEVCYGEGATASAIDQGVEGEIKPGTIVTASVKLYGDEQIKSGTFEVNETYADIEVYDSIYVAVMK